MPRAVVMLALIALGGCDGCEGASELPPPPSGSVARSTPSVLSPTAKPATREGSWTVWSGDAGVLQVKLSGETVLAGPTKGAPHGTARRYLDQQGQVVIDASRGPMAILRDPSGAVVWRFSLRAGGTRFWQGEAKTPTSEMRGEELWRGDELLGRIRRRDDALHLEDAGGAERFVVRGPASPAAVWAPLLFPDLEEPTRAVLVAEALLRAQ